MVFNLPGERYVWITGGTAVVICPDEVTSTQTFCQPVLLLVKITYGATGVVLPPLPIAASNLLELEFLI